MAEKYSARCCACGRRKTIWDRYTAAFPQFGKTGQVISKLGRSKVGHHMAEEASLELCEGLRDFLMK